MMKNVNVLWNIAFVFSLFVLHTNSYGQCGQLIWSDEFDGTTLDTDKWAYDLGNGCPDLCGWGNAELQSYTNSSNNIRLADGNLEIEARNNNGNYTSAKIITKGLHSWKYGRFEMRAKLAEGTGLWPAFWLLPVSGSWPMTGEIDIMENRGDQMSEIGGTLHYGSSYPSNQHDGSSYTLDNGSFADDFHVFAAEWEQGEIRWFVDGELFKTETSDPNTLNPTSSNTAWPWDDQEFYLIINMAIGGSNTWYTGTQAADFGTSATMEVDYVRVYNAAQPSTEITGAKNVFKQSETTYSTEANATYNYTWEVPTGASIVSGQGTNSINVNWGNSTGGDIKLAIEHQSGSCAGNTFTYTFAVDVFDNDCNFVLESFDEKAAMSPEFRNGQLSEVSNPASNAINGSTLVGQYERNSSEQYDVLIYENALLDQASDYTSSDKVFKLDVMTVAPIGTKIQLQVGNTAAAGTYPAGVHSVFEATTTTQNEWESLTFEYISSPDANGASYANDLDRVLLLFNPNSYTNHTYYFDNFKRVLSAGTSTLSIDGPQAIEENETGLVYSATGGANTSSYEWTLPEGAVITDGALTETITVDFGDKGGRIYVSEVLEEGCASPTSYLQVAIGNNDCLLFADEFDDNTSDWITIEGDAGYTSTEAASNWNINSTGHDQWASINYEINNGTSAGTIDFSEVGNKALLQFRAKATSPVILRATLVDANGVEAANDFLLPVNTVYLTNEYQDFTIDFEGQFWDQFNGGGELDTTQIETIRLSINPGWSTYPEDGYGNAFTGDIQIDYIRIGESCSVTGLEKSAVDNITIHPNPFTEQFVISGAERLNITTIEITNAQGELISSSEFAGKTISIDESNPAGIFFVRLTSTTQTYIKRIIKQ